VAAKKRISSDTLLRVGLGACALLVVVALVSMRLLKTEPPPPSPPPPQVTEKLVTGVPRYTETYYRGVLDEDTRRLGLQATTPAELAAPLVYALELESERRMKPQRDTVETPHLRLTTSVLKEWASTSSGQRYRYEHLVLSITNHTDKPLAYRVDTTVDHPEKCGSKGAIAHNALAIGPGETLSRTECLWHPGAWLAVKRVEVMELPKLSFHYVSRLVPTQVLLDERTSAGHESPKSKPCPFVPWREIQSSAQSGSASWADVIDFYARHNCDEYSFYRGYRRWKQAAKLPARSPEAAAAAAP